MTINESKLQEFFSTKNTKPRKEEIKMGDKEFISLAKREIAKFYNEQPDNFQWYLEESELYVVWLVKVLQNNKALLSTSRSGDGLYFEVTNNGDKGELYIDVYKKQKNVCIKY